MSKSENKEFKMRRASGRKEALRKNVERLTDSAAEAEDVIKAIENEKITAFAGAPGLVFTNGEFIATKKLSVLSSTERMNIEVGVSDIRNVVFVRVHAALPCDAEFINSTDNEKGEDAVLTFIGAGCIDQAIAVFKSLSLFLTKEKKAFEAERGVNR